MKVEIDAKKLVVQIEDHGGYLVGECLICRETGWYEGKLGFRFDNTDVLKNHLIHKKNCPLNKAITK